MLSRNPPTLVEFGFDIGAARCACNRRFPKRKKAQRALIGEKLLAPDCFNRSHLR